MVKNRPKLARIAKGTATNGWLTLALTSWPTLVASTLVAG